MRTFLSLILISVLLSGCETVPTNEQGTSQQSSIRDRRTPETIATDKEIEQAAREELQDDQELSQSHININAYNGLALMTGEVPSDAIKNKVLEIVRVIPHVAMVRDSLTVAQPIDSTARANDAQLTTQVKTALTQIHTLPDFNSAMIKVVTENGIVYLMGRVSREEGTTRY
ncbi:MAG: BON domain-containing protein [Methylococcaceae bacterium]|nr:BON domain-containing protein [Methylococcaceae bacterium]